MIDRICETKYCTGCKLCEEVCPANAIHFETNSQGFWYPMIDGDKCIECKKCIRYCPVVNHKYIPNDDFINVYAAYAKDDELRISSTSGGVFGTIAKKILNNGGVVAGCTYADDWKSAKHILISEETSLYKILGSKYFQSDTAGIYGELKKALEKKQKVLFCGTPCQVAAARTYLGDDNNIIYVDFICRSINSPLAFSKYLEELEKQYNSKVVKVHLKNKDLGWQSLATKVYFDNGNYSLKDKENDYWIKGFITNGLYTRPSCNACKFREIPHRNADITVGDFWGIKNESDENLMKGVSVVLVNSKKGIEMIDLVKDQLIMKISQTEDVLPGNRALYSDPAIAEKQDLFFELLKEHEFSYCVKECTRISLFRRLINKVRRIMHI